MNMYLVLYKLDGLWIQFVIRGNDMEECFQWSRDNVERTGGISIYSQW